MNGMRKGKKTLVVIDNLLLVKHNKKPELSLTNCTMFEQFTSKKTMSTISFELWTQIGIVTDRQTDEWTDILYLVIA